MNMKTNNRLLLGLVAVVFAGFTAVSCEKESLGVSKTLSYPTIEITGGDETILNVGDTYTELGAVAKAGEQTLEVTTTGNVDTSKPGIYPVSYTAEIEVDGIMLKKVSMRKVCVFAPVKSDISGTYKIEHTSRTTEMTISRTSERDYRASDTWWQATKIPTTFVDCGDGVFTIWPVTQNSPYGEYTGPITYDYDLSQIRFDFVFVSGNTGVRFNWAWNKQ